MLMLTIFEGFIYLFCTAHVDLHKFLDVDKKNKSYTEPLRWKRLHYREVLFISIISFFSTIWAHILPEE